MDKSHICIITILVLLLLLCICFHNKNKTIEGYDTLTDTNINTLEQCANKCKTTLNCNGFAFNEETKGCYLSKSKLDEYANDGNKKCNKLNKIDKLSDDKTIQHPYRLANSVYTCRDNMYLHNDNKMTKINNINELKNITDIEEYDMKDYKWEKINIDKAKASGWNLYDYSLDNADNNLIDSVLIKQRDQHVVLERDPYKVYKIDQKFSHGDYLKDYKCVSDIPFDQCIQYCSDNKDCVGVEWNPLFMQKTDDNKVHLNKNVCCPKRTIGKLGHRDLIHEHGTTYIKQNNRSRDPKYMYLYKYKDPEPL
jgi:hypothetical protein